LPSGIFGEGCTSVGDRILQLTYKNEIWLQYDNSMGGFDLIEEDKHKTWPSHEGWGLSHDENFIYGSDGTEAIYVFRPDQLEIPVKAISVVDEYGNPIWMVNELEVVGNFIYAN